MGAKPSLLSPGGGRHITWRQALTGQPPLLWFSNPLLDIAGSVVTISSVAPMAATSTAAVFLDMFGLSTRGWLLPKYMNWATAAGITTWGGLWSDPCYTTLMAVVLIITSGVSMSVVRVWGGPLMEACCNAASDVIWGVFTGMGRTLSVVELDTNTLVDFDTNTLSLRKVI